MCKECIRDDDLVERVDIGSVKNHFICKKRRENIPFSLRFSLSERKRNWVSYWPFFSVNIESTGSLPPDVLFTEAVKILEAKCETVLADEFWVPVLFNFELSVYQCFSLLIVISANNIDNFIYRCGSIWISIALIRNKIPSWANLEICLGLIWGQLCKRRKRL